MVNQTQSFKTFIERFIELIGVCSIHFLEFSEAQIWKTSPLRQVRFSVNGIRCGSFLVLVTISL